eukprot:2234712-Amphidinium_carterae.1
MRPPPQAQAAPEWRYSDPQPVSTCTMINPLTTPTGLFDLSLINQDIWMRLLPIATGVSSYASSLYRHMTDHIAFARLTPVIDILLTAFINLGHVMQVHICTPTCRRLLTHSTVSNCIITSLTLNHIQQHFKAQWSATERYLSSLTPPVTQSEQQ